MKSRKRIPWHLVRWMRKLDQFVLLKPHTKFVNYGDGLVRAPTGDVCPAYRMRKVRTKVIKPEWD